MRYLTLFILISLAQISKAQIMACDDLWEGAESNERYYIGGRIDGLHVFRLFLCRHENGIKGYYEMVSSRRNIEVEGFFKGDSVFLAEYSPHQRVLGMIRGRLTDSVFVAGMSTPSGTYTGEMKGNQMQSWVSAKTPPTDEFTGIVLYKCPENPDETLLLTYPNDYSFRGILNNRLMQKTFYTAGKRPEDVEKKYRLNTHTYPPSGAIMTCHLDENGFTQTTLPGKVYTMKASLTVPLNIIEKSNRHTAYGIYYPKIGPSNASNKFLYIVNRIRTSFDSIYQKSITKGLEEVINGQSDNLTAWFEPSYFSDKWICGHFIIQNDIIDSSHMIAVNYNYKANKMLDLESLISSPDLSQTTWNQIIANQDTELKPDDRDARFSSPVMAYHGILLSTPFDRLFDRQLFQTDKKIKGVRWKWWKPEYWEFKLQQN